MNIVKTNAIMRNIIALFLFLPVFQVVADDYYVAPSGASGKGSIDDPWSLDFANKQLLAGDRAILMGGLYKVSISPQRSGDSDTSRIIYEAYPGAQPIVDLGRSITGWTRFSGADNDNAVYRANGSCDNLFYSNYERVGRYVMLWARHVRATRHVATTTDPNLLEPGDFTNNGDYIYLRTGASDNPSDQNVRCAGSGHGVNLANKNYISVSGITIRNARRGVWLSGASNNVVEKNVVEYSAWRGVDMREGASHNVIRNNTIKGAGSIQAHGGGGIQMEATYNLIEENKISWTGHDGLVCESCSYNVIRNNTFTKAFGKMIEFSGSYGIIEHNRFYDGGKRKEIVRQHNIDHPMISVGGRQVIVRHNTLTDGGLGINVTAFKQQTAGIIIYNNTVTQMHGYSHYSRTGTGVLFEWRPGKPSYYGVIVVNNLIFNNYGVSDRTGDRFDSQLGWNNEFDIQEHGVEFTSNQVFSEKGESQLINGEMNLSQFEAGYSAVKNNLNAAPLVNSDLSLTGSPSGKFLTNTKASGTGNKIYVDDARYFSDGHGVVSGDRVIVGGNAPVTITNVDYSNNIITFVGETLTWNDNDNVSLIYNESAPTIGAGEIVGGSVFASSPSTSLPSAPTNLQMTFF